MPLLHLVCAYTYMHAREELSSCTDDTHKSWFPVPAVHNTLGPHLMSAALVSHSLHTSCSIITAVWSTLCPLWCISKKHVLQKQSGQALLPQQQQQQQQQQAAALALQQQGTLQRLQQSRLVMLQHMQRQQAPVQPLQQAAMLQSLGPQLLQQQAAMGTLQVASTWGETQHPSVLHMAGGLAGYGVPAMQPHVYDVQI